MRAREFLKENAAGVAQFVVEVPAGNRGPEVADLQKSLVALGYELPKFGVDGIVGPETSGAIRQFQQANQIPATGNADQATVDKINSLLKSKPALASKLTKSTATDVRPRAAAQLPALARDSVTQGRVGSVLDLIATYESRGNYNIILGGKIVPELTRMTLNQVYDFQRQMVASGRESSAVGRYQYIRSSLEMVARQMGLDPETTVFDPKTQDAIAVYDLRKRAGLDQWLAGQMADAEFLNRVARIWASIPTTGGASYYAGVGSNRAGVSSNAALAALSSIRSSNAAVA